MKLIDSFGPNPRIVRMFLLEKGIAVDKDEIDLVGGETHQAAYKEKNPTGLSPCLQLDDGSYLGETVAICELFEELNPKPPLIGTNPIDRAKTRMWCRRVELYVTEHMFNGFRFGEALDHFQDRVFCVPEAAEGLVAKGRVGREWLDALIGGNEYIAGDRFTLADIFFFCAWDFLKDVGQPIDPDLNNLNKWFQRISERPSAQDSLHPMSNQMGWAG